MRRPIALALLGWAIGAAASPQTAPIGFVRKLPDILVHRASGTEFPKKVAGFTRTREHPFDLAGKDVAIAYRLTINGHPVAVNIAMIQIYDMTPKEHYLGMKSMVGRYFKDLAFTEIAPRDEGAFTPVGMKPGAGFQGRFHAMQDRTPYELSLSTVKLGKWDIRVTAAYPAATAPLARQKLLQLVSDLRKTAPKPPPR